MAVLDLANLPSGTRVFVDTNIFTLYFANMSATCNAFIQRVQAADIHAFVNSRVMLDLLHKLMLAEAFARGLVKPGTAGQAQAWRVEKWLSKDRTRGALLTNYQGQFEAVFSLGVGLLRTSKKTLVESKTERMAHGLMAGDSIHVGCMARHKPPIADIVTCDGGFDHIPGITIWKP
ncbi:MAG: hypothetical protein KJ626_10105 [Verrucomicrobia bacterium]|nr:hypothetical protein [Verrucomicrobiota bacterium]